MSISVLLYWNVSGQFWQVTEDFAPSGGQTFGKQWFLLPEGFSFDGKSFSKAISISGGHLQGQYQGDLKAGQHDVIPGSISVNGASYNAVMPAALNTDTVSKWPYLSYNGINAPLLPFNTYRGARNG